EVKTVFISSHMLSEVQQICTSVVIFNRGKLISESSIEELSSGRGEYTVRLERANEALALIQKQPWGRSARLDVSGALVTLAPEGRGRNLNLFLVNAGFAPD